MLGQFIDATGSQKFKKLDPITCTDRAVSFQSFQISTKMRFHLVTSALSVFLYKQIRTTFVKQKNFLTHGTVSTVKSPTLCHQLHVKMAFMTKIKFYSNDLQYIN